MPFRWYELSLLELPVDFVLWRQKWHSSSGDKQRIITNQYLFPSLIVFWSMHFFNTFPLIREDLQTDTQLFTHSVDTLCHLFSSAWLRSSPPGQAQRSFKKCIETLECFSITGKHCKKRVTHKSNYFFLNKLILILEKSLKNVSFLFLCEITFTKWMLKNSTLNINNRFQIIF